MKLELILALSSALSVLAVSKQVKEKKHDHVCSEFSKGVQFNDSQALGTWHLLQYHTGHHKYGERTDIHCLQFLPITMVERKALSSLVGNFVENLKWEKLTLKMEVPCGAVNTTHSRIYYLEQLGYDGAYRTLQIPPLTGKQDLSEIHRYQMRFKPIEEHYLAMMDCHESFVFLLGRQTPRGEIDERIRKKIQVYWPEEE